MLALALVLLLVPLSGCFGDDGTTQEVTKQEASVTQQTGGIEGIVTDASIQPVVDANVTLVEPNRTTTTSSDGSYAFSEVDPGSYEIRVTAPGFVGTVREVSVVAGEVSTVEFVLAHEQLADPFQQTLELKGFVECGVGWKQTVADMPTVLLEDSAFAACAVPNLYLPGGNATNDRFLHRFDLEPPLTEVVYELEWPTGDTAATAPPLRTILEVQGFINAGNLTRPMDVRGDSPIRVDLEPDDWAQLSQNFTDKCNGDNGTEEDEDYCGHNFRASGWPLVLRVFATGDCFDTPASTCLVLQQEFTHYVSAFYNQRAPSGYGITDSG